jgi:protein containing a domain related to multimeric flavodoxin wrbA family
VEEKLLELIQKIAEVKGDSNAEVELENKIAFETGKMEGLSLTEKESIVNTIAAKLGGELYTNIFFAFWSWIVTEQNSYLMKQVKELINSSNITWQEKYYLADQINFDMFNNIHLRTPELEELVVELHHMAIHEGKQLVDVPASIGAVEQNAKNKDLVIILTSQFLSMNHGPTKTALDRAYILQKYYGKKVFLINTAEMRGMAGEMPVYPVRVGSYMPHWNEVEEITYQGEKIAFFQCYMDMPNIEDTRALVQTIWKLNPAMCLNIGGGRFTSSFKPKQHTYVRKDFGLPEDAFLLVVVGLRLTEEISDEFVAMLDSVLSEKIQCVIMGKMVNYEERARQNEKFRKYVHNLGLQEDALAIYSLCDLYLNPIRLGGGTSAAESMSEGVPVLTTDLGDVALEVEDAYKVKDYEEMKQRIFELEADHKQWEKWSQAAKEKAEELTDSKTEFIKIIKQIEKCMESKDK